MLCVSGHHRVDGMALPPSDAETPFLSSVLSICAERRRRAILFADCCFLLEMNRVRSARRADPCDDWTCGLVKETVGDACCMLSGVISTGTQAQKCPGGFPNGSTRVLMAGRLNSNFLCCIAPDINHHVLVYL